MKPIGHTEPEAHHNPPVSPDREFLEVLIISSSDSDRSLEFMDDSDDSISIDSMECELVELYRDGVLSDSSVSLPPTSPAREASIVDSKDLLEDMIGNWLPPSPCLEIEHKTNQDIQTVSMLPNSDTSNFPVISSYSPLLRALMIREGLQSRFPMDDLTVMGVWELIPHMYSIMAQLQETIEVALDFQPHVVVTIDSKGFAFCLLKCLRANLAVHEVEPVDKHPSLCCAFFLKAY
eukprot:Gb_24745 [translate_table: standard]